MKWFILMFKNYAGFTGRASRPAFWWAFLIIMLIFLPLAVVDEICGTMSERAGFGLLSGIFMFSVLIPSVALTTRRLHDSGLSGWWQLLNFIPLIGIFVVLILLVRASSPGANQYGEPDTRNA